MELCNLRFELLVDVLRAAYKSDTRHAESVGVHHALRCLHHSGMVRKSQVVICTEIDYALAVHSNLCVLSRSYHPFSFVGTS